MGCNISRQDISDEIYCNDSWRSKNYDDVNKVFTEKLVKSGVIVNSKLLATIVTAIINCNYKSKCAELNIHKQDFEVIKSAFLVAVGEPSAHWARCYDKLIATARSTKTHVRRTTFTDF